MQTVAIIDYGVGNLFSLAASFQQIGAQVTVTNDPAVIHAADRVVLPGVGAFADAAARLRAGGLDAVVRAEAAAGKPLLGICLGMQMLFSRSHEYGVHEGLGLIDGEVTPITPRLAACGYEHLKVPHIGWNALRFPDNRPRHPLFRYLAPGDYVYFVHSYAAVDCADSLIAETDYGVPLTAAVACGSVWGTQFHPEKSGKVGLAILRAFCEG